MKIKSLFLRTLSLVLIISTISITSCNILSPRWSRIADSAYNIVLFDSERNIIWVANVFGTEIIGTPLTKENGQGEYLKIKLPPDRNIWGLCLSTDYLIAFVNTKSTPYSILMTYSLEQGVWEEKGSKEYPLSSRCKVLTDGSAVIAFADKFDLIKNNVVENFEPGIGKIWDVIQDNQGDLWAITLDKSVFVMVDNASWKKMGISEVGNLFHSIKTDSIWISTDVKLYRLEEVDDELITELVYENNKQSRIIAVYSGLNGGTWIVSSASVVRKSDGSTEEIPLPFGVDTIYSSAFDSVKGRIIIATDEGLYSIEINQ